VDIEIRVFSSATGKLLRVLLPHTGRMLIGREIAWANAAASAVRPVRFGQCDAALALRASKRVIRPL
jgi:hypothetical protein